MKSTKLYAALLLGSMPLHLLCMEAPLVELQKKVTFKAANLSMINSEYEQRFSDVLNPLYKINNRLMSEMYCYYEECKNDTNKLNQLYFHLTRMVKLVKTLTDTKKKKQSDKDTLVETALMSGNEIKLMDQKEVAAIRYHEYIFKSLWKNDIHNALKH